MLAFAAAFQAALSQPGTGNLNLTGLAENPAIRALYGVPFDISNRGGFAVWRGSTTVLLIASLWGALTATRVLRGEEDAGRWDLLLAQPLRRTTSTALHIAVLATVCLTMGLAVSLALLASGAQAEGSVLFGAGVALLALTFTALGACAAQVFGDRRTAAGASGAMIGGAMVLRMAADASSGAAWVRWLTPFGWVEQLQAFADNRWVPLIPLAVSGGVLLVLTMVFAHRRDLGDGLIHTSQSAPAKTRLLRDPLRFAWRQRLGGLAGWSAGVAFYGVIVGAITATGSKFIAENSTIEHVTERLGMTGLATPAGFVASLAPFMAVVFALQGVSSLGRCHEDEEAGRLDLPYSQPVTRSVWLGSQVVAASVTVLVAVLVSISSTWLGAAASNAGVSLHDITVATLNVLPAAAVFFGLAIMLLGLYPNLAVPLGAGAAVAAYVLTLVGPALKWPSGVTDLSPFTHLTKAPVAAIAWGPIFGMIAVGLIAAGIGFFTYQHRDLA
jgi:ABC-2 type transport system permease protein